MGPIDVFWHVANFFGPAVGLGVIASSLAKLLWRRGLAAVSWPRLCAKSCASAAVVSVGGLLLFGRDGRMATYAAMVGGCAVVLWVAGWRGAPRRAR